MSEEVKIAAEQEAQAEQATQAEQQQPETQPEPQSLEEAMFGAELEAAEAAPEQEQPEAAPAENAEVADKPAEDKPAAEQPTEPAQDADLTEPEGLGEKASARFRELANQVKEYRAKDAYYQQMDETVQEFQRLAQESCNNGEEVAQLFDYAKAVKTGDFDTVEAYLRRQIQQFEALSGRSLQADLLSAYPDLQQQIGEMGLDAEMARQVAAARWQQQQQQEMLKQQQARQQQELLQQQQWQETRNQAAQGINDFSAQMAKTDLMWPQIEPKLVEYAQTQLGSLPPEQWLPAIQAFYNGIKQTMAPVRQAVQPLRASAAAAARAEPQTLEDAMFGGL
jgi:PREDICTED: similar to zinc finger protein 500